MIVSEQDSETSLNRRKPRPPADAASIWIRFVDRNVSGAIGRCWHTLHGNFTPCGSHRLPPLPATAHIVEMDCAGSFPPAAKTHLLRHFSSSHKISDFVGALQDASTLGLRLDNRISPICGSSPPSQPRLVCARKAAPPIPPFSSWDRGLLNPARLSFRAHIGCIQCTYSIFKLSPARTDVPLPVHSCRMASVEMCLKLSRIFRREQKRKAADAAFPCRSGSQICGHHVNKLGIGRCLLQFNPGNQIQEVAV